MALATRPAVPWVELDGLHHGPGWAEPDPAEFRATVAHELDRDGWVVDGELPREARHHGAEAADTVVWLDLPLRVTVRRHVVARSARRWWRTTELWNGNRESLRGVLGGRESLLYWASRHTQYRRKLPVEFAGRAVRRQAGRAAALRSARCGRGWPACQPG